MPAASAQLTADEGDDKEYGKFEEKQKFKDVIDDDGTFKSEFADTGFTEGDNAQELADAVTNFGDTKMAITIGSLGVDYSDPAVRQRLLHIMANPLWPMQCPRQRDCERGVRSEKGTPYKDLL